MTILEILWLFLILALVHALSCSRSLGREDILWEVQSYHIYHGIRKNQQALPPLSLVPGGTSVAANGAIRQWNLSRVYSRSNLLRGDDKRSAMFSPVGSSHRAARDEVDGMIVHRRGPLLGVD